MTTTEAASTPREAPPAVKLDPTTDPTALIAVVDFMERSGWRPQILTLDETGITVRLSIIGIHRIGADHVQSTQLDNLDTKARALHATHMAEHGDDRDLGESWAALDDQARNRYRRLASKRDAA